MFIITIIPFILSLINLITFISVGEKIDGKNIVTFIEIVLAILIFAFALLAIFTNKELFIWPLLIAVVMF